MRKHRITTLCVSLALASGCMPLRNTGPAPTPAVPPPLGSVRAAPPTSPNVVPAGGVQSAEPVVRSKFAQSDLPVGEQSPPAGLPLAPPRSLAPGVLPGDPHARIDPTLYGKRLNLGPYEQGTDRVVDLTRYLESIIAQNGELLGRIQELERVGIKREQALVEALREVEAAASEIERTRGTLASQKAEITTLQEKIRQLEKEDIETLRAVILALEKLLPPPRREP